MDVGIMPLILVLEFEFRLPTRQRDNADRSFVMESASFIPSIKRIANRPHIHHNVPSIAFLRIY